MSDKSGIEWTDATWNPVVGCSVVSPGCTNCYAMKFAGRVLDKEASPALHYHGTTKTVNSHIVWTGKVAMAPDHILLQPLKWKRPRKIFVNSMGDLFHESVPDDWIDKVFAVMALCPQHTFQVLTKRSKRMREYCSSALGSRVSQQASNILLDMDYDSKNLRWARAFDLREISKWPLFNVWLGVSAEDQTRANERIPDLLATPAAVRFVSAEPLLGPIDFASIKNNIDKRIHNPYASSDFIDITVCRHINAIKGLQNEGALATQYTAKLDWIIVGGESGQGARPIHPDWARSIRDQCEAAGTAFFFKQWGEWAPCSYDHYQARSRSQSKIKDSLYIDINGKHIESEKWREPGFAGFHRFTKKYSGNLLDNKTHTQFPEVQ